MVRAVIFDCFGVLATEGWYAFRDRYFPEGSAVRRQAIDLRHATDRGLLASADFERQLAALAGVSVATVRAHLNHNAANEPLFAYIRTKLKPHYLIGMLSNAANDRLEELFSPAQRELFDAIVLSYQIRTAKPDPRAYEAIAARLGVRLEECVFVDDSGRFCMAAEDSGMHAICYQNVAQCQSALEPLLADTK